MKIFLNFCSSQDSFFFVCFSLYRILESENNSDNDKTFEVIIWTIIKNPEMLKFVPHDPKTKIGAKIFVVCINVCYSLIWVNIF